MQTNLRTDSTAQVAWFIFLDTTNKHHKQARPEYLKSTLPHFLASTMFHARPHTSRKRANRVSVFKTTFRQQSPRVAEKHTKRQWEHDSLLLLNCCFAMPLVTVSQRCSWKLLYSWTWPCVNGQANPDVSSRSFAPRTQSIMFPHWRTAIFQNNGIRS
jgi:hypothetical protein